MFKTPEVTQRLISFSNTPTVLWLLSLGATVALWHLTCFWGWSSLDGWEMPRDERPGSTFTCCLSCKCNQCRHILPKLDITCKIHLRSSVDGGVGSIIWTLCYHDHSALVAHLPCKTLGADGHILQSHFLDAKQLQLPLSFPRVRLSFSWWWEWLWVSESLSSSWGSRTCLNNINVKS